MSGASTGPKFQIPGDPYRGLAPVAQREAVFIQGQLPPCNRCKGAMNRMVEELGVNVRYAWQENQVTKIWDAGGGLKWR